MNVRPDLKRHRVLIVGCSELCHRTGAPLRECGAHVGYADDAEAAGTRARLTRPGAVVICLTDEAFHEVFNTARLYALRVVTFVESAPRLSETVRFKTSGDASVVFADPTPLDIVRVVSEHATPPPALPPCGSSRRRWGWDH